MTQARSVQALVEYESSMPRELLETFVATDVNVWMHLRSALHQPMLRQEFPNREANPVSASRTSRLNQAKYLLPHARDARKISGPRNLLFVVAGRTRSMVDGRSMNWLTDYFALDFGSDSVVIQYRQLPTTDVSPLAFGDTYSQFRTELLADVHARVTPVKSSQRNSTLELARSISQGIDFEISDRDVEHAAATAIRHQARVVYMRDAFRRILDEVKPKVLIMDGAMYGGTRAVQVQAAKERGIHVAELQHGWVGGSHGAYQLGRIMWEPELRQYLPDTLLTFGEYWGRDLQTPAMTLPIGKPHLEAQSRALVALDDRPKTALVVSNLYSRKELLEYSRALRDALPSDWTVLVRPHPFEWGSANRLYAEVSDEPRIRIDLEADVSVSLRDSRIVLGYASTVLYEAVQFRCVPIVLDSPLASHYLAHPVFTERVANRDELRESVDRALSAGRGPDWTKYQREIWEQGSIDRFRGFIEKQIEQHSS